MCAGTRKFSRKTMRVTQTDVALRAGVDRSTVSRVLNKNRTHRVGAETAIKILKAAKDLGYDKSKLKINTERRAAPRKRVDVDVDIDIVLKSGQAYDRGTATIENMSVMGALLVDVRTEKDHLPMVPFYVRIMLKDELEGIMFRADFIRMQGDDRIELGIRFERMLKKTQDALKKILEDAG
jgi:transcriptional regulator with XRE-family HTH domain